MLVLDPEYFSTTLLHTIRVDLGSPYSMFIEIHNAQYPYWICKSDVKYMRDMKKLMSDFFKDDDGNILYGRVPLKYRLEVDYHIAIKIPKGNKDYEQYYEHKWMFTPFGWKDSFDLKPPVILGLDKDYWEMTIDNLYYIPNRFKKELKSRYMMNKIFRTVVKYNNLIRTGKIKY